MRLRGAAQALAIAAAVGALGAGIALGQSDSAGSLDPVSAKLAADFRDLQADCSQLVTPACEQAEERILAYGQARLEGHDVNDPALLPKTRAVMGLYRRAIATVPVGGSTTGGVGP